ncbi:ATP-binding protein [Nonomuraea sp. LPB2021202275-12-8]|uniref:ATP-binding protein n=1 Tax=Nonomuraea sp. LPB2021202275-12-8 TaxID=3120159 RepID=UPI00300C1878
MLKGRRPERSRLERLLAEARDGRSGALAVRGEAGVGKSALLDDLASAAHGMRLLRGVGIETEAELPFSGLHLLLHPFVDRLDVLPEQQAEAMRSVFGLAEVPVRDPFLVGAATLTLLSDLAGRRPLVCLIDDAQWLDRASSDALLFAARRLHEEPIVMVFAVRDTAQPFLTPGIEAMRLDGLDRGSALELLLECAPELTVPVRDSLLDEAGGNPLALIELAHVSRNGPVAPVGPLRVTGRVQDAFRAQSGDLPDATRLLLLLAAADGTAELDLVLRAGASLGASPVDLGPAEEARLVVTSGDEIRFRHPLIRSAVYQSAPHHQRIAAHAALARALSPAEDHDRRTWHRAAATTGPDEEVAGDLERTAERARHRGGTVAVALAYERAARLSADQEGKAQRIVRAARSAYDAGRPGWATRLATEAAALTDRPAVVAEAIYVRAQVAYESTSPAADAALALQGATLITRSHPERAVSMLTEAVWAARDACAHDLLGRAVAQLETVQLPPDAALRPVVAALIGYGRLAGGDPGAAVVPMRALVEAVRAGTVQDFVERVIAGFMGLLTADDDAATDVLESLVADVRAAGALGWLPYALEPLAIGRLLRGDFRGAQADVAEGLSLASDIGMDMQVTVLKAISVWLAAVTGDVAHCRALAGEVREHAAPHPTNAALAAWGEGLLDLADGRFEQAADRLDEVCGGPARHDLLIRAVPDQVEAAIRAGRAGQARRHLPALAAWAEHSAVGKALESRCQAMLGDGDQAEQHYRAALELVPGRPYELSRTRLVYGEWLRRKRRRSEARAVLAQAEETFARLGAARWAERARAELAVLGDRPVTRAQADDPLQRLTPQELQVVRLAAAGHSNREIAARLYLSPRTVGHHLYRAYPKIGVTRRMELAKLEL